MNIDKDDRSELHYAALEGNAEKVRALIQSGALINRQCKQGWAALHCAAQTNCCATASLLLEAGADLELRDVFGNTPLWRATMSCKGDGSVIELLLCAGANPNAENKSGVSPVLLAKTIGNDNVAQFYEKS
ncbi:ankyrin repeat domain-containing protein [Pseudoalteromonas luteoviolacea]|uniref:ankyrin repeat domain-containing protein n=1 Tax=Pseudoalteromonas luteoviolacea TaxID=43657 RepID=UPI001F2A327D|nr:ankyrin repeat domain-containing protein [Pseudoalteromonas luteoviolacea]MCF6442125.1 ankyrin repeat domain-containing protein [Pseudoalteromonas luteoviolacea]